MKTDDLIRALGEDTTTDPSEVALLARYLPVAMLVSFVALWLALGPRDDLRLALTSFPPLLRHVLTLALFAVSLLLGLRLLRPEAKAPLWVLAVPMFAALGAVLWALQTTPSEGWQMALEGKTQLTCLVSIPLLSIPPVAAFLAAFKSGATTRPAWSGALAGMAGGALGAAIYAFHCIEDSPLFFVTWYGVAIAIVTAASAILGSRFLRW